MILLTDEELLDAFDSVPDFQVQLHNLAKAQARKIFDWGNEDCPHMYFLDDKKGEHPARKHECSRCWSELKKEIEG